MTIVYCYYYYFIVSHISLKFLVNIHCNDLIMIFASMYNTDIFSDSPTAPPFLPAPFLLVRFFLTNLPYFHVIPLPWPMFPAFPILWDLFLPPQATIHSHIAAHVYEFAPRSHIWEKEHVVFIYWSLAYFSKPCSIWHPGQTQMYRRNAAESGSIPCPNILMTAIAQSTNLFYSTPQTIAYLNFNYATSRWH